MIILTKNFYVFEVDRNQLKTSNLYLNTDPIKLSEKYPKLSENHGFRQLKFRIFNSFIVIDNDGSWLCFTTTMHSPLSGINYNIDNSTIINGWEASVDIKEVLISTTKPCKFYAIRLYDGEFQISTYECSASTVTQSKKIKQKDRYRSICYSNQSDDKEIFINNDASKCEIPVKWPILSGFVAGEKFYLFGKDYIYTFDEIVYQESSPEKSYPVRLEK